MFFREEQKSHTPDPAAVPIDTAALASRAIYASYDMDTPISHHIINLYAPAPSLLTPLTSWHPRDLSEKIASTPPRLSAVGRRTLVPVGAPLPAPTPPPADASPMPLPIPAHAEQGEARGGGGHNRLCRLNIKKCAIVHACNLTDRQVPIIWYDMRGRGRVRDRPSLRLSLFSVECSLGGCVCASEAREYTSPVRGETATLRPTGVRSIILADTSTHKHRAREKNCTIRASQNRRPL